MRAPPPPDKRPSEPLQSASRTGSVAERLKAPVLKTYVQTTRERLEMQ
jgi:hypothetical protein